MSVLFKIKEVREITDISEVNNLIKGCWMLLDIASNQKEILFIIGRFGD